MPLYKISLKREIYQTLEISFHKRLRDILVDVAISLSAWVKVVFLTKPRQTLDRKISNLRGKNVDV